MRALGAGQCAEEPVFQQQHGRDDPAGGAQGLEDGGLVDTAELRHRHRSNQDEQTAQHHERSDNGDGEGDVVHDRADRLQNLPAIDDRNVRRDVDEVRLEPTASPGIGGTADDRLDEGVAAVRDLVAAGAARRVAADTVATLLDVSRNDLYRRSLAASD